MSIPIRLAVAGMIAAICWSAPSVAAPGADARWLTSYPQAVKEAKRTGKVILANFTGSDWCHWCIKLKAEVFDQTQFKTWAGQNAILLELDFPRRKRQSTIIRNRNRKLMNKYKVEGFPTILFLDVDGSVIGRSGYMQGGAANWVQSAQSIVDNRPKLKTLELSRDLLAGMKEAREKKLPLLVIVQDTRSRSTARIVKRLLANKDLINLSGERFALVHAKKTAESAVDAVDTKDAKEKKALDDFIAKHKLRRYSVQAVLLDVENDKVLLKRSVSYSTKSLMAAVQRVLPQLPYNGEWLQDFAKAKTIAEQRRRPLLLDFTGSDWCGWCIRLKAEVFDKQAFKNYASQNLVLVELDFPRRKKLPAAIKEQNNRLRDKYGIRGYPTIILLDARGNKLGKTGYIRGGPSAFIREIRRIIKR